MLIDFSVGNFNSFNEEKTLSMLAGRDTQHPRNYVSFPDFRLLKSVAVYGANASGKSNLISAMVQLSSAVSYSATTLTEGDSIPFMLPFRLERNTLSLPCSFRVRFLVEGMTWHYSFSSSEERVFSETLYAGKGGGREKLWYERTWDSGKGEYVFICGPVLKMYETLLRDRTRQNALVLSVAARENVKELHAPFLWIRGWLAPFTSSEGLDSMQLAMERYESDADFAAFLLGFLHDADVGIQDMRVDMRQPEPIPKDMRKILSPREIKRLETPRRMPSFFHPGGDTEPEYFPLEMESSGVQILLHLLGPVYKVLREGGLFIVDEIENSLHWMLASKLIEFFHDPELNTGNGQLIFTSHNPALMSPELFRRDQIWFTEKQADGGTDLYSLYDINDDAGETAKKRPRGNGNFEKHYREGRYGGVPVLGPMLMRF